MKKTITIIGGSGFVGRAVARQAVAAGFNVRVGCRHPEKARAQLVDGVSLYKVDIGDGSGLTEVIKDCDVVINLVGLLYEKGKSNFDSVHIQGTRHILEACQQNGITRYLHMSALGADSGSDSAYARSKHMAEEAVRHSQLDWTIMQPSVIFGQEDDFFNKLDQMSALIPIVPVIAAETYLQPVWVEDVARAFIVAISDRTSIGQTFKLAGPRAYSFMQLVKLVLQLRERQRLCLPVPPTVASIMAKVLQRLPVPPLTSDQLNMLKYDNIVEGDEYFPDRFGSAASVESILPTYLRGVQASRLQRQLDHCRENYRRN